MVPIEKHISQNAEDIRAYLESIIALMPGHIYWKDLNCRFLGCNDLQAKVAGLHARDEIVGLSAYDIITKNQSDELRVQQAEAIDKADKRIMRTGIAETIEEPLIAEDGSRKVFLSQKVPLKNKKGNIIGLLGISIDITEQKKLEDALTESKNEAEKANRAKSTFIANISHDVKVPLSGIIGISSLMENDAQQCNVENAKLIHDSGSLLLIMMNKILDFVKLESPDLRELQKDEMFSISSLVNDIVTLFTPAVKLKNIDLKVRYSKYMPTYILSKPGYIHKIITNLIGNAVKFTNMGELVVQVDYRRKAKKSLLIIQVKDTGIGIPDDKREIVFEWFERLTPAYKGRYQGTGLGLAMVKQSIDALHGSISIETNKPQGTNFICEIPIKTPKNVDENQQVKHYFDQTTVDEVEQFMQQETAHDLIDSDELVSLLKGGASKKILLIEDDKTAGVAAKQLLKSIGYQVKWVLNGEAGVIEALNTDYDIILTDIGLPGISGIEVLEKCREAKLTCPIYALTGHGDVDMASMSQFSFTQVMYKPLNLDELHKNILQDIVANTNQVLKIINLDEGVEILGEREAAEELLQIFILGLPEVITQIKQALVAQDIKALRGILHRLLGAASYASVPELNAVMLEVQSILKTEKKHDAEHLTSVFDVFFNAVERLLNESQRLHQR